MSFRTITIFLELQLVLEICRVSKCEQGVGLETVKHHLLRLALSSELVITNRCS